MTEFPESHCSADVGSCTDFEHSRTVLRYQDAAIQILDQLLPAAAFDGVSLRSPYLSSEPEFVRERAFLAIERWWRAREAVRGMPILP